jgi:hypothetical protein
MHNQVLVVYSNGLALRFLELVHANQSFQHLIETVEHGNPVEQVSTWIVPFTKGLDYLDEIGLWA